MKSFCNWLIEMARWKRSSWQPPSTDAMERLKKYKTGGYYASFTDMPTKIGINPQPIDITTPYGIYAYPVPYVLAVHITDLPIAGDKPYIWVIKPKNPKRIIKISEPGDPGWKKWGQAVKFRIKNNDEGDDDFASYAGPMNAYFKKYKIHGFVDQGTSRIHVNEPTQAVFFGSHTIIPIEVIPNNYSDDYVGGSLDVENPGSDDPDDVYDPLKKFL